jgi:hypothetical protein
MLDDEDMLGYLWLRGWHQVLYMAALVVKPESRRQGIARQLVAFAEKQAVELRRDWIGVSVAQGNMASQKLFEEAGYTSVHSRVWSTATQKLAFPETDMRLQPVRESAAWKACREYTAYDLEAGNAEAITEPVAFIIDAYPIRRDRQWLLEVAGTGAAYLNLHRNQDQPTLYIASKPEWRAQPPLLDAIQQVTQGLNAFSIQFASRQHHVEAQPAMNEHGFEESKLPIVNFYKRLNQQ